MDMLQFKAELDIRLDYQTQYLENLITNLFKNQINKFFDIQAELQRKYPTGWLNTTEFSAETNLTKRAIVARIRAGSIANYTQHKKGGAVQINVKELLNIISQKSK